MQNYEMEMVFAKSKPLIILRFDEPTTLQKSLKWNKKFHRINSTEIHISTTIIEEVFRLNEEILGKWTEAKLISDEITVYYGFEKQGSLDVHSLSLSKRFIGDWIDSYSKLSRYTVNTGGLEGQPPIIREVLYDASIYGDGTVGNVTRIEVDCLRKVINPDGEIITRMKAKLNENKG